MASYDDSLNLQDYLARLRQEAGDQLGPNRYIYPPLDAAMNDRITRMGEQAEAQPDPDKKEWKDGGLAQLVGVGPDAADKLAESRLPPGVEPYDETVTSERVLAIADLYYIYQHERIGVFRVMRKLQELFRAGSIRLSAGPGAYALYQFDRREVLRYTWPDRLAAFCRAFGYCARPAPPGGRANTDFHRMFTHFNNQVALFWRDKRISDVIRERAYDPSFGSIAIVRRSGLDLRNNLKFTSYGHLNVLRVEVMQLLEEAFKILGSADVRRIFGADTAWDVIEDVLTLHFNERLVTSPRQRMAVAGREVLRWLAQPHILQTTRAQFESLLLPIAEYAEEWLTSAESLGLAQRAATPGGIAQDRVRFYPGAVPPPPPPRRDGVRPSTGARRPVPQAATTASAREYKYESEL